MDCCEFREHYSDFADGLLDDEAELRARRHLSLCAPCRRFDAAFRAGVSALRDLPSVQPSRSFGDRLHGRLGHELVVRALAVDPISGAVAAMLVMVTIGLVTWDLVELRAARRVASNVAQVFPGGNCAAERNRAVRRCWRASASRSNTSAITASACSCPA